MIWLRPMKILGIDYGASKVGLALGDTDVRVAVGKGVLQGLSQNNVISKIKAIVNLEYIERLVVGLPLNLAGEPTETTHEVQRFVEKLRNHLTIPVQMVDERYTSQMADRAIQGVPEQKNKQDQVAAQYILQTYLDSLPASPSLGGPKL